MIIQEQVFFIQNVIISAFKRVDFISDRMSYVTLRGCCLMLLVSMCMHKLKIKDSFYEEPERVLISS
jgi:hypothetical protein